MDLLGYLENRRGMPVTPASAAQALGVDRKAVQAELTNMVKAGLVSSSANSLGVIQYVYREQKMKADKPRGKTRPFTPNQIAGAYTHRGNVVIKLTRRANAKSVTITRQDFANIAAFFSEPV